MHPANVRIGEATDGASLALEEVKPFHVFFFFGLAR